MTRNDDAVDSKAEKDALDDNKVDELVGITSGSKTWSRTLVEKILIHVCIAFVRIGIFC